MITQSPASVERERRAQTRSNRDWVDMINTFWGRRVVTTKNDTHGNEVIAAIVSPWIGGYPPERS